MRRAARKVSRFLCAAFACGGLGAARAAAAPVTVPGAAEARATAVVYNVRDPLSEELGRFYAEQRGIPPERVLGLECSIEETIGRDEYDATIARPLREAFAARNWWAVRPEQSGAATVTGIRVRFVALMRGIPLRIAAVSAYPGDAPGTPPVGTHNEAAVDSEVAALGVPSPRISGVVRNPYFRAFTPVLNSHIPPVLLVCRLDGPTGGVVRRMIVDAIAAERVGLWGRAYVDMRGIREGDLAEGDEWLRAAAEHLWRRGVPVVTDARPATLPPGYPMIAAAHYYGWYAEEVDGPFRQGPVPFVRGAVALHIHSFSADTVRTPLRRWVGPLLARGAVATAGNVFEPFLGLTVHVDLFVDRLLSGLTFAESAYAAMPAISWMGTVVGDPLYRPYGVWNQIAEAPDDPRSVHWREYRRGAILWMRGQTKEGKRILEETALRLKSPVIFEGLANLQLHDGDRRSARRNFQQARALCQSPAEAARLAFSEADWLAAHGRTRDALAVLRDALRRDPTSASAAALRAFELELAPPPPPPPSPAAAAQQEKR